MRHSMYAITLCNNIQQEQHVFPVTDAAQDVRITLRTTDGAAIATATHPLAHAFAWGAERCRLALVHPETNGPAGSLHVGFEFQQQVPTPCFWLAPVHCPPPPCILLYPMPSLATGW